MTERLDETRHEALCFLDEALAAGWSDAVPPGLWGRIGESLATLRGRATLTRDEAVRVDRVIAVIAALRANTPDGGPEA